MQAAIVVGVVGVAVAAVVAAEVKYLLVVECEREEEGQVRAKVAAAALGWSADP